jgi:hypothetical protein
MTLLNVSFGIFAFLPQGWIFMAFVILLECLILTKLLTNQWYNKGIYYTSLITNAISGIVGIIISIILNGGWWLVIWFPWVSDHEINTSNAESLKSLIIYYACAFLITIIIEILINWLLLKKKYITKKIIVSSILANIISYIIGSGVLYLYSFN